ncbi:L-rhamnose mutarotase [Sphingomonas sp. BGYR3]|uniref:L-rhamnose mutarotase n=1 Tax=Sphingomonas sp. BGYR3 TaxID=2975483 RepID=UPI0021A6A651|nr:L-rhamnose mutarotase [Sphingomonas sp. BGYR3]
MALHAFRMQLKPGNLDAYRAAHDAIWPELVDLLHDAGISDYSIFHDADSNALFAVLTVTEPDGRAALPDHPVMKRWWDAMAPLMETHADNRPVEWPLDRVFHLA